MDTFSRLCPRCRIRWIATMATRGCPKCGADPFFTMNIGDIGTHMHLNAAGLTVADFSWWPAWCPPRRPPA